MPIDVEAVANRATLATRNIQHFADLPLTAINPWAVVGCRVILPRMTSPSEQCNPALPAERLSVDFQDLFQPNRFDAREASGHEWQEVFQPVRLRKQDDDPDLARS